MTRRSGAKYHEPPYFCGDRGSTEPQPRSNLRAVITRNHSLSIAIFVTIAACGGATEKKPSGGAATDAVSTSSSALVTLTVTVEGTGGVRSEPAGIECPGQCSADFPAGTHVKLVAAPAEGWKLDAWSGGCSGAAACEVDLGTGLSVASKLALIDPRWDPSFGEGDCRDAWGNAGEKLSPCDKAPDNYVVVHKTPRNIALCNSGKLVKNARIGLGFSPVGDKAKQGDGRTPEGVLYVAATLPNSDYHRAFLLSYPRKEDAARAYNEGLIDKPAHDQIIEAQSKCEEPLQDTALGGAVEIHGEGSSKDWTAGCIGMENEDIDRVWDVLKQNDTIVVLP